MRAAMVVPGSVSVRGTCALIASAMPSAVKSRAAVQSKYARPKLPAGSDAR